MPASAATMRGRGVTMNAQRLEIRTVGAITIAVLALFAAVGLTLESGPAGAAQYDQYDRKVTICHHAGGKNGTKHVTIGISRSALPAHLRHGDTAGACATRAARTKHASKAHVRKFHTPAKATKAAKGKGKGKGTAAGKSKAEDKGKAKGKGKK
jgi:hypothetical protein